MSDVLKEIEELNTSFKNLNRLLNLTSNENAVDIIKVTYGHLDDENSRPELIKSAVEKLTKQLNKED